MNHNILGYGIFLGMIAFIIIIVGKICYRNGNIFVAALIPGQEEICKQINKILLIGYYLINIGYATMTLADWVQISSLPQLVEIIAAKIAVIISILSVLHYLNIAILTTSIHKLINHFKS